MVEFDIQGSSNDIDDAVDELYELVSDGITVTFNGVEFTTFAELYVDGEVSI